MTQQSHSVSKNSINDVIAMQLEEFVGQGHLEKMIFIAQCLLTSGIPQ